MRRSVAAFMRDGCIESPPPTEVLGELQSYGFAAPTDWAIKVWSAAICQHPFFLPAPSHQLSETGNYFCLSLRGPGLKKTFFRA